MLSKLVDLLLRASAIDIRSPVVQAPNATALHPICTYHRRRKSHQGMQL